MRISARGSKPLQRAPHGFTLIELLVVVAIVAIASAAVVMALRDPAATQLEREAERLAGLFEGARAESRASGMEVDWLPLVDDVHGDQFRFVGLPDTAPMPRRWLSPDGVAVEIVGARSVKLGPEPMIGAQRVILSLGPQRLELSTDGLAPFTVGSQAQ
ncbi:prepilin-type N-terminal cleavage/methylation domain-containing protein [Pelomonas sp. KK5]|uniref:prepilin-type N-terminal cleavage/methylation domain-containing protein n=1 Tax=Pelomonas sp. KK5 TaxID=1855730 RepID=UPI00097C0981|nr:prepilin-type N-terminal cleavage/methylation domain-containing protein [Pelomonas sp. KK5]